MASSNEEAVALEVSFADIRASLSPLARVRAFYELGKPNLSGLVVITGIIGFYLASNGLGSIDWWRCVHLVFGMGLTAAGACALNMYLERDLDRLMRRTRTRPIPSGRVSPGEALVFSAVVFSIGFLELAAFVDALAAILSLVTLVIYAFAYTPMKRHGPISIWIGAVPGALPPVMGWAALRGEIGLGGAVLFAILFCWQIPHFLALAWMYRDDYARAGFRFLPQGEDAGVRTGRSIVAGCAVLIGVSLLPASLHMTGTLYAVGALLAGLAFFIPCLRVARDCTRDRARSAFIASVTYLPALLALMILDRLLS